MEQAYLQETEDVLARMGSSDRGLDCAETDIRRLRYGFNKLKLPEKPTLPQRFRARLAKPVTMVLIMAAAVSAAAGLTAGENPAQALLILAAALLEGALGLFWERSGDGAAAELQAMTAVPCKVLRSGIRTVLPASELVPGDVVILKAGDRVPADGRILECKGLKMDEAAITGDGVIEEKEAQALKLLPGQRKIPPAERKNMCLMGSLVVSGRGRAVITATGMDTELGKIATFLTAPVEKPPLQRRQERMEKTISGLVLVLAAVIFLLSPLLAGSFRSAVVRGAAMAAVSVAVAVIPEGLALVTAAVLSLGAAGMSRRNGVFCRPAAVETLGHIQVIFFHKASLLNGPIPDACRNAGIRPVLITGESPDASFANIWEGGAEVVTGARLDELTDAQILDHSIFIGICPEQKMRILMAWKGAGAVTAMTGTDLCDAPSVRAAHVGVCIGAAETDVTKNAADLVLSGADAAPIIAAAEQGRRICGNLRRATGFLLTCSMGAGLGVFFSFLLGFTLLSPAHLLFSNLVAGGLFALALGLQKEKPGLPGNKKEKTFSDRAAGSFLWAAFTAGVTVAAYIISHSFARGYFEMPTGASPEGMTAAFLALTACQLLWAVFTGARRRT